MNSSVLLPLLSLQIFSYPLLCFNQKYSISVLDYLSTSSHTFVLVKIKCFVNVKPKRALKVRLCHCQHVATTIQDDITEIPSIIAQASPLHEITALSG